MGFHVPDKHRMRTGWFRTDETYGNNGAFLLPRYHQKFWIIASDGSEADKAGLICEWEHVSVSIQNHPNSLPTWEEMCWIKSIFWDKEDVVVQFHPAESEYVNFANVLHLWRHRTAAFPTPPHYLVGPKPNETEADCIKMLEETKTDGN